jgi:glucose/arabinose dehydrogenase
MTTPGPTQPAFTSIPSPAPFLTPPTALELEQVFPSLDMENMVFLTHAGDGTDRLFLVLQEGRILVFPNGQDPEEPETFLDIQDQTILSSEEGLLGLAFDPDYETNRRFYVYYSAGNPRRSVVSRFTTLPDDPNRADPNSESAIMEVPQPFANHNGGMIAFGPDGYLYIGLGDGGSGGDPLGHGQSTDTLLGSLLRIDVTAPEGDAPYSIPPDNPFIDGGGNSEIWAYGLRNPWRFSFDRATGRLWLADVGQRDYEEVNLIVRGGNYGWNLMEGFFCYPSGGTGCGGQGFVPPVAAYDHSLGCSVSGGYVYRGPRLPALQGYYLYADFCSGRLWGMRYDGPRGPEGPVLFADTGLRISSFGEDEAGEVYLLDYDGGIYRLAIPE